MTAPIWDIALRKQFRPAGAGCGRAAASVGGAGSGFTVDLAFTSASPRLVLFGPSGTGKTQTLRMIAGITAPDSGWVRVAGRSLYDSDHALCLSPAQRRLGYVFQDYALFPHLSVRQNIAFALTRGWRNPGRRALRPRVESWLERFQLQAVADHLPHQISGGQRQRTALARALVAEPAALLLDEPFAALDKALRQRLRQELLELQTTLSLPLLLITHDEDDLRHLAAPVVQIDQGRAVAHAAAPVLQPACSHALPT